MAVTPQHRIQAYQQLHPLLQDVYSSSETISLNADLIQQFAIPNDQESLFINLVGDCVLGFHKTTALPGLFQSKMNMSADDAQRLTSALLEYLSPVIEREQEAGNIKREELQKLADTFAEAKKNQPAAPVVEAEVEPTVAAQPEDIQPLRTMQSDVNRIHGYGAYREQYPDGETVVSSSQADALATPAAPPPTPPPASPPAPETATDGSTSVPITSPLKAPEGNNPPPTPQS